MKREDKELLEKHKKALIQGMSTEALLEDLVDDNIFDSETQEQIEEMKTPEQRAERLLKAVMESTNPKAMESFLETLKRSHDYLYDLLKPPGQSDSRPLQPPIHEYEPQISPQPPTSPTMKLNEHQLWEISNTFQFPEWRHIGHQLKLSEGTLQQIKHSCGTDLRESAVQMLRAWKEQFPDRCTIEALCEALQKLNKNDMAKKLKELASFEAFQNSSD